MFFFVAFLVKKFMTRFFEEGPKVSCDDSQKDFTERKGILPDFYDEEKFKRFAIHM